MSLGRFLGLVLLLEFGFGLDWRMDGIMGQVEKERLVLVLFDKLTGFHTQPISQVLPLFLLLEVGIFVGAMVSASTRATPGFACNVDVKPLRGRIIPQVPFSHGGGNVSARLKSLADGYELFRQMNRVLGRNQFSMLRRTSIGIRHGINTMPRRILPGHQACSAWSAIRSRGIGVHKNHSLFCQLVDVRTLVVFRAHVTEIRPAHVVDKEKHDVGLGRKRSD